MTRHARLGPSSSDIWLNCLGAPGMWITRPPRQVGYAAREGSLAHAFCEASLTRLKGEVTWREGMTFTVEGVEVEVTQEMLDSVKLFVQTATMLSEFAQWRMIEEEVSLLWMWEGEEPVEEVFGTLDFATCDGLVLYIMDFKYGAGKTVKVDRNTQLLCYALGALGKLRAERPDLYETLESVCLAIVQPRAGGQPVRQWTIPVSELLYWGFSTLKPAIDLITEDGPLPLTPGNHCWWCAASIDCPVYLKMRRDEQVITYPDYDPTKEDLEFEELV